MSGFRKFLMRGNLIDLAVAVVIGVAFNNIVQALVTDMVTPLISAAGGGKINFASLAFHIHGSTFAYGLFLNSVLSFLIIALVVYYFLVAPSVRLSAIAERNKAATDRQCPECLSQIPVAARRCMYCTSEVPPVEASATSVPQPRRARHGHPEPTEQPSGS
jgi:large conductance mechanosensitive channel